MLKSFQLQGGFAPWPPDQGLCPWNPLGALPPDPRYRLALSRSPRASLPAIGAPPPVETWRRRWLSGCWYICCSWWKIVFCYVYLVNHCYHHLLPSESDTWHDLRHRGHSYQLVCVTWHIFRIRLILITWRYVVLFGTIAEANYFFVSWSVRNGRL